MTAVALASAKASPGVSTLALALAATWPHVGDERRVLIEADGDGGSLAARLGLGYEPGLVSLASASRRGIDEAMLSTHVQAVDGVDVICGPASAEQAHAALGSIAERLAQHLARPSSSVTIVDLGRAWSRSPGIALAREAALTLLVLRPRLEEVQHTSARLRDLERAGCVVGITCVGDRPYAPEEVAESLGVELVGVIADDERGASLVGDGGFWGHRSLLRTPLWRTASDLSQVLAARLRTGLPDADVTARLGRCEDHADVEVQQ